MVLEEGLDRSDHNVRHKLQYNTVKKYKYEFKSILQDRKIDDYRSTKNSLLNALYAIERFSTLNICEYKDIEDSSICETLKTESQNFIKTLNQKIRISLENADEEEELQCFKDYSSLQDLYNFKWEKVVWSMFLTNSIVIDCQKDIEKLGCYVR